MSIIVAPSAPVIQFGRFLVEARIGAGGMGVVYRARDPETGQPVAIKVLERNSPDERARFRREARVMSQVDHPNVVRYHDHGTTDDDRDFLVMDLLAGHDLNDHLLLEGPLAVADALRLTAAAAEGLAAVHELGVVHRDVKPGNLFLVERAVTNVRVMDFGIARMTDGATPLTTTGAIIGTPLYMAPEQLRAAVEQRSDIYGLGATLFHCLAGRPPFIGDHPGAVVVAILSQPVPHLSDYRGDVPDAVDAFVGRMLAKDPRDRPADMRAVVTEVAALLSDRPQPRRSILSRTERGAVVVAPPNAELIAAGPSTEPARTDVAFVPAAPMFGVDMRLDLFGRARPLSELMGVMDESREEGLAREVVIVGAPGVGKSRVLESGLVIGATRGWRCLSTRGNRERATRPFSVLQGLLEGVVTASDFVTSLERLGASPGAGPRIDPLVEADRLALAWLDLLDALSDQGPLLLVIDDAHQCDLASSRYIDRAVGHLAERALVVIKAQPEDPRAPPADTSTRVTLALGPLRRGALGRLAERWASGHPQRARDAIVARCEGDLGYLRELARSFDDGAAPITGTSRSDAARRRLERLGPDERRVLRAASIAGEVAPLRAIANLLGVADNDVSLARYLRTLVAEGALRQLIGTHTSFEFPDGTVQDAVYDSCTLEDLVTGHLAMSEWLLGTSTHSPIAVARHLERAGDQAHAARYYLIAARAALTASDASSFDDCLSRAQAGAPPGELRGEVLLLASQGAFWRSELPLSCASAREALDHLGRGGDAWFQAASLVLTAAGQIGDNVELRRLALELLGMPAIDARAEDQRIIALCRAATQIGSLDPAGLELFDVLGAVDPDDRSAEARAWLHRARAIRHMRDFDVAIDAFTRAYRAYVEAGDARLAALMGLFLSSTYTWIGAWERAEATVEETTLLVRRLGATYLVTWARYTAAKALAETAPLAQALEALDAVVAATVQSPRMQAGALVYAAIASLRASAFDLAEDYATRAASAHSSGDTLAASVAVRSRCLVAQGLGSTAPDVLATLERELAVAVARTTVLEFDELVRLAHAELLWALDARAAAREAIAAAAEAIEKRAATLTDPMLRNHYFARPHIVATTLRLRHEWRLA